MPTYVYEVVKPDGSAETGSRFEIEQSIKADALAKHPESGKPVRRVIQSISILGGGSGAGGGAAKPQGAGPGAAGPGGGGRCGPSCGCH